VGGLKGRAGRCRLAGKLAQGLSRDYVAGSQTLRTLRDRKLNTLTLVKGLVSVGLDGRVVNEYVISTFSGDEAVSFRRVEPFYSSCFSQCFLLLFILE